MNFIKTTFMPYTIHILFISAGLVSSAFAAGTQGAGFKSVSLFFILGLVFGTIGSFITYKLALRKVAALIDHVRSLNAGSKKLTDKSGIASSSDVGELAGQIDFFSTKMNDKLKNVAGHASTLLCASKNMLKLSEEILGKCDTTRGNTDNLSGESRQVEGNMTSVAAAVDQTNSNIDLVAAASEEMYSTISEITKNMEAARVITQDAVSISRTVTTSMDRLGSAAKEITNITETIAEISDQTNLLALNATIESARAGEAGKGFAVVANEIKSLAEQTSSATLKIKEMVTGITTLTNDSGKGINDITKIIDNMDHTVSSIATALEQQSSATREISENAHQASQGIGEINTNVLSTSNEVGDMSGHIQNICDDAEGIGTSIFESKINADETQIISEILMASANELISDKPKFDIGSVKLAHMGWRVTLEAVLAGHKKLEPENVVSHKDCLFGKWYGGEGKIFSSYDLYNEIGIYHEQVHNRAKEVIRKHNANDASGAQQEMEKFLTAKTDMFGALDKLYLV